MTRSEAIDLAVRRSIFDGGNMRTVQLVPTLRRVDVFDAPDIFLPLIRTEFYKIMAGEK